MSTRARPRVEGYCWPQSVEAGEAVGLHLAALDHPDDAAPLPTSVRVVRAGRRPEVVFEAALDVAARRVPEDASTHGCGWPASASIPTEATWPSGFYEVVLTSGPDGKLRTTRAFFVVRSRAADRSRILLALATNTYHAYNDFGGRNLYTGATQVSLQRPMAPGYLFKPPGSGRRVTAVHTPDPQLAAHNGYLRLNHLSPWAGSAGWPDWEQPFLEWAEREGYRIDLCTNADLQEHPDLLGPDSSYRLFLSVGHDEYWSGPMRDSVEGFVARGGNAVFFSGNTSLWQVRLEEPSPEGPMAVMVGYKAFFRKDPVYDTDRVAELTGLWSDVLVERPENEMTGVSFTRGGYHRIGQRVTSGLGGYTVERGDHWVFDGTGLDWGDVVGAESVVVGYECDGCELELRDGLLQPTHADGTPDTFTVLATTPTAHFTRTTSPRPPRDHEMAEDEFIAWRIFDDRSPEAIERISHGRAVMGTYTTPAGGTVFTAGSTDWAHGLDGRSPRIEQITRNLLDRLG